MINFKHFFRVVIFSSLIVISIPFISAFTLQVDCPPSVISGQQLHCTLQLLEDISAPDLFAEQFILTAPGFLVGTPYFNSTINDVSTFQNGSLNSVVVLLSFSPGQSQGTVASFNLISGTVAGIYTVSVSNTEVAENIVADTVDIIVTPTTSSGTTVTSSGGTSSAGGSSSSSGGSSAGSIKQEVFPQEMTSEASVPIETSSIENGATTNEYSSQTISSLNEDITSEDLLNTGTIQQSQQSSSGESDSTTTIWLIAGIIALVVSIGFVLIFYLRLRRGE